jgi:hypothetical protein
MMHVANLEPAKIISHLYTLNSVTSAKASLPHKVPITQGLQGRGCLLEGLRLNPPEVGCKTYENFISDYKRKI